MIYHGAYWVNCCSFTPFLLQYPHLKSHCCWRARFQNQLTFNCCGSRKYQTTNHWCVLMALMISGTCTGQYTRRTVYTSHKQIPDEYHIRKWASTWELKMRWFSSAFTFCALRAPKFILDEEKWPDVRVSENQKLASYERLKIAWIHNFFSWLHNFFSLTWMLSVCYEHTFLISIDWQISNESNH